MTLFDSDGFLRALSATGTVVASMYGDAYVEGCDSLGKRGLYAIADPSVPHFVAANPNATPVLRGDELFVMLGAEVLRFDPDANCIVPVGDGDGGTDDQPDGGTGGDARDAGNDARDAGVNDEPPRGHDSPAMRHRDGGRCSIAQHRDRPEATSLLIVAVALVYWRRRAAR